MKSIIEAFANNTVFANILLMLILLAGGMATVFMIRENWPEFSVDVITISVVYPGADPEEVEEALKHHAAVDDCNVVGTPDPRWGQAITAVVQLNDPAIEDAALIEAVKDQLAGYKAPKAVVFVGDVPRAPNGKADYKTAKTLASA